MSGKEQKKELAKISIPVRRQTKEQAKNNIFPPFLECDVVGNPTHFPVLFCGGVVYDELLTKLAKEYGIKLIVPKFPYWNGGQISDMGYDSLTDITVDSMISDLQAVVKHCFQKRYIPYSNGEYSYAVAGGSYPGWLAMLLRKRDSHHCIGLNLFATPPITLSQEELSVAAKAYLQLNDLQENKDTPYVKLGRTTLNSNGHLELLASPEPGLRQIAQKASVDSKVSTLPAEKQPIKLYQNSINASIWSKPQVNDDILWKNAKINGEFLGHFFSKILPALQKELSKETSLAGSLQDAETLIIAGIHDFTSPYHSWLDDLREKSGLTLAKESMTKEKETKRERKVVSSISSPGMLFRDAEENSQVRFVISNGGHLPQVVDKAIADASFFNRRKGSNPIWPAYLSQESGFAIDMAVVDAYRIWSKCLQQRWEQRKKAIESPLSQSSSSSTDSSPGSWSAEVDPWAVTLPGIEEDPLPATMSPSITTTKGFH